MVSGFFEGYTVRIDSVKKRFRYAFYKDDLTICVVVIDKKLEFYGAISVYYRLKKYMDAFKSSGMDFSDGGLKAKYTNDSGAVMYKSTDGVLWSISDKNCQLHHVDGEQDDVHKIGDYNYRSLDKKDVIMQRSSFTDIDLIRLRADIDLSWIDNLKNYWVCETQSRFDDIIYDLANIDPNEYVGFDTETTGLHFMNVPRDTPGRDRMAGICLSYRDHEGIYIPTYHRYFDYLEEEYVAEKLKPFIDSRSDKKLKIVTHNGKFDMKVMFDYNIELYVEKDTFLVSYVRNNGYFRQKKDLKFLVDQYYGIKPLELTDYFGKNEIDFSYASKEFSRCYACADPDFTRLIAKDFNVGPQQEFILSVEHRTLPIVAHMEHEGLNADVEHEINMRKEYIEQLTKLEKEVYTIAGEEFKIGSAKELGRIVYGKLKYTVYKTSKKTGEPSCDKFSLKLQSKEYNEHGDPACPLSAKVLEYRKCKKHIEGHIDKIINENIDGRIYCSINQTGTDSGRFSYNGPNVQQTPKKGRLTFKPDDGCYFLIMDYSQQEYRLATGMGHEYDIVQEFQDPDSDFHSSIYSKVFGIPLDAVTEDNRNMGKVMNFAFNYGLGDKNAAIALYTSVAQEKIKEAVRIRDIYNKEIPNVTLHKQDVRKYVMKNGYVETYFKRRRYFDIHKGLPEWKLEEIYRASYNTVIQGSGADVCKIAMVRFMDICKKRGIKACIRIVMHDEIVAQAHFSENPWRVAEALREAMMLNMKDIPPLYVGTAIGDSWYAAKDKKCDINYRVLDKIIGDGKEFDKQYSSIAEIFETVKEYTKYVDQAKLAASQAAREEEDLIETDDDDDDVEEGSVSNVETKRGSKIADFGSVMYAGQFSSVIEYADAYMVRLETASKNTVAQLIDYLKNNSVKYGKPVLITLDGKQIDTGLKMYKLNKVAIANIVA